MSTNDVAPTTGLQVPEFTDITYERVATTAVITMNRPHRYNAFRAHTVDELILAFRAAESDRGVQSVILTGAGDKAFCTGGDVKQRAETGDYGPSETGSLEIGQLHKLIRDIPKPVIAAVNGAAIGGGHVLHVLCDLTIAADTARFGQSGPKVGSFDAGFGSAYLARVVGENAHAKFGISIIFTTLKLQNVGAWPTRSCRWTSSWTRHISGQLKSGRNHRRLCDS